MRQDYPDFEVIVVNDRSWDGSADVLEEFCAVYPNLRVINLDEKVNHICGKKLAVTLGIKGAIHENLLFTDADCYPSSDKWIKKMTPQFVSSTLILGFSPYENQKGILNKLIRFDAIYVGIQYLSYAMAGIPYMGVGRNMAYKRELFYSVGGFRSHYALQSGDDDLFVNEAAQKNFTHVIFEPDSQMISYPKRTFKDWWRQKSRHFTTSDRYKFIHKFLLALYPVSGLIFYLTFVVLLFAEQYRLTVLILLIVKVLIQLLVLIKPIRLLGGKDLVYLTPFLELFLIVLHPIILLRNYLIKPVKWS